MLREIFREWLSWIAFILNPTIKLLKSAAIKTVVYFMNTYYKLIVFIRNFPKEFSEGLRESAVVLCEVIVFGFTKEGRKIAGLIIFVCSPVFFIASAWTPVVNKFIREHWIAYGLLFLLVVSFYCAAWKVLLNQTELNSDSEIKSR